MTVVAERRAGARAGARAGLSTAALLLVGLVLSGCGHPDDQGGSPPPDSPVSSQSPAPAPGSAAQPDAEQTLQSIQAAVNEAENELKGLDQDLAADNSLG